ncbi:hypothetical protein B0H14DRAFT_3428536 [Mycena olivaceomarginata]|nr:hypothetical protein B0H14DRAFT_3428536 [Mycena olivaceomarginata]
MASHTASTVAAIASLKTAVPSAQVGFIAFDLTILSAARAAAEEFWERKERIGFERGGGECFLTSQVIYSGWGWQMAEPCELTADEIELQALDGTGYFTLALPFSLSSGTPPPCQTRTSGSAAIDQYWNSKLRASLGPIYALAVGIAFREVAGGGNLYGCAPASRVEPLYFSGGSTRRGLKSTPSWNPENILFTNELQRRLAGTSIYCRSRARRDHDQHLPRIETDSPATGTHASYPWLMPFSFLEKYALLSSEQGARAQLSAATAPEVEERDWRAAYLAQRTPSSRAQDEDGQLAAQFEALYEKLVAEAYSKVASS